MSGVDIHARIDRDFAYQRPHPEVTAAIDEVRTMLEAAAHQAAELLPPGREQSLAITHLEEALFWSRAALVRQAIDDGDVDPPT